jgi:hypothetical protein
MRNGKRIFSGLLQDTGSALRIFFAHFIVAGFRLVGSFLGALFLPLRAPAVPVRLCKECAQSSRAAPFF